MNGLIPHSTAGRRTYRLSISSPVDLQKIKQVCANTLHDRPLRKPWTPNRIIYITGGEESGAIHRTDQLPRIPTKLPVDIQRRRVWHCRTTERFCCQKSFSIMDAHTGTTYFTTWRVLSEQCETQTIILRNLGPAQLLRKHLPGTPTQPRANHDRAGSKQTPGIGRSNTPLNSPTLGY